MATRFYGLALTLAHCAWMSSSGASQCQDVAGMSASIAAEEDSRECQVEQRAVFQAFLVRNGAQQPEATSRFKLGDRVVLCIDLPFDGHVSVWDIPPAGKRERLYPNAKTHRNGTKGVLLRAGRQRCLGEVGSGYQIQISQHEGRGSGRFHLVVTDRLEQQPDGRQFDDTIHGQPRLRGMPASVESEPAVLETIGGYADASIDYIVY